MTHDAVGGEAKSNVIRSQSPLEIALVTALAFSRLTKKAVRMALRTVERAVDSFQTESGDLFMVPEF